MTAMQTCLGCDQLSAGCQGACPCKADPKGRCVTELAELHECPLGKFKCRGLGDLFAAGLRKVGITKKPGCGCGKRQKVLNRLIPFRESAD